MKEKRISILRGSHRVNGDYGLGVAFPGLLDWRHGFEERNRDRGASAYSPAVSARFLRLSPT